MTEEKDLRITVINEEYNRVLSNPDNMIVSEDLQELIDLPMSESSVGPDQERAYYSDDLIDTATLSLHDNEGLPLTARGRLLEVSFSEDTYTVCLLTQRVTGELLRLLEAANKSLDPKTILISGIYETEARVNIIAWSIKTSAPHEYTLEVKFRSDDVIF
jgi:hypothetical protein